MKPKKIIVCLDIQRNKVVKGVKFSNFQRIGDPIALAKKYSKEGTDELAMLNLFSSPRRQKLFLNLTEQISRVIKIPLIVGGDIKNLSEIGKLLKAGANKVCLYTSIVKKPKIIPELINEAAKKFGSKKIIAGIDVKKKGKKWQVVMENPKAINLDAISLAKLVEKKGAGEILLTSMDRDGTKKGFDIQLLRKIKASVSLPIIIAGGAGEKEDFLKAFLRGGADGALAASIFHSGKITIPELKIYLRKNGVNI